MKLNKEYILNFIGIAFILIFLFHMINKIIFNDLYEFFWLCNHVPLVTGIAILFRKQSIIVGEFCLLGVASFLWNLDLILSFVLGRTFVSGIGVLLHENIFYSISISLIHLSFIPLSLIAIFLINKKAPRAWIYGAVHGALLIPFAFIFRNYTNLNCMLKSCLPFIPNFYLYPLVFIFGYIFLVIYPLNKLINKFLKKI